MLKMMRTEDASRPACFHHKKINLDKSLKNSEGFVKASVFQGFLRLHPL
jgi:hypothetical protein